MAKRKPKRSDTFRIVGVGASAGGLVALTELIRHLPRNVGVAFVVVQHLDPTHVIRARLPFTGGAS